LGGLSRRGQLAPVLLKTQVTDVVRLALSAENGAAASS